MEITAAELRCAWLVLACLFLATPPPGSPLGWAIALASLIPGTWLLTTDARGFTIAQTLTESLTSRPMRLGLIVGLGLAACMAWIFSVSAALSGVLVCTTACLFHALRRSRASVQGFLAGTLTVGAVTVAGGLLLELLLGRVLGDRVGAPSERMEWARHYAELRQRHLFGFRSPYENVVPAPGVSRILALGDSYTWGDRIARTEDTWPGQLERLLQDSRRDVIEVINTGRSGWTTVNEAELLRRFGWQWQPDIVVLQFTLNDVKPSGPGFRRPDEPMPPVLPQRFRTGVVNSSALLFLLEVRLATLLNPYWREVDPHQYHPDSLAWQRTDAAFREIAASAAERGIPVILLIYPSFPPGTWTTSSHPERRLVDQVATAGASAGMEVLDLVPVFAAEGGDWRRWWAAPYDQHPNVEAHGLAARAVAARIHDRGYLARCPCHRRWQAPCKCTGFRR